MSKLVITRPREWINKYRKYKIYLDGNLLGAIKNDEILEFDIPNGQHTLIAKVDWCSSNEFPITVLNNETFHLKVTAFKQAKWLMPLTSILGITVVLTANYLQNHKLLYLLGVAFLPMLYFYTLGRKSYLLIQENKL